jgi:O-antigen/teichoic acid export membrane protein
VLDTSDRLIIQAQLGPAEVGRYQVAYNVGALPMLLLGVLNASWMPRIFSFTVAAERAAVIAASRDLLYRLLVPTLVGLAAMAPLVLRIWAPASFRTDELLLVNALVVVSSIPFTAALSSTRALMAEGRTHFLALAQALAAALNIALNLLLLPVLGLLGSALATALALGALAILLSARTRAVTRFIPPSMSLLVQLAGAAAFVMAIAFVPGGELWAVRLVLLIGTLVWFARVYFSVSPVRALRRSGG